MATTGQSGRINGDSTAAMISSNAATQSETFLSAATPKLSLDDAASGLSRTSSVFRDAPLSHKTDVLKQRIKDIGSRSSITEFYVSLEDRARTYYQPGEPVRGTVMLELAAPTKSMYVQLKLVGSVHVSMSQGRMSHVFFEDNILLWGTPEHPTAASAPSQKDNWKVGIMDGGEHIFDFEFCLPAASIPSSIEFGKGSISYVITAFHKGPNSFLGPLLGSNRSHASRHIQVRDLIDVVAIPPPKAKIFNLVSSQKPFFRSKRQSSSTLSDDSSPSPSLPSSSVFVEISLPRAGFMRGDAIKLSIRIKHNTPIKNLRGSIITFYRSSRFISDSGDPQQYRKDLAQTVSPILCDPRSLACTFSPRVRIPPDTFPTNSYLTYVSFRYFVEILLDLRTRSTVWQGTDHDDNLLQDLTIASVEGPGILDTSALKREKNVITHEFEVIIGTIDSSDTHHLVSSRRYEQRCETDLGLSSNNTPTNTSSPSSSTQAIPLAQLPPPQLSPNEFNDIVPTSKADALAAEQALLPSMPPDQGTAAYEEEEEEDDEGHAPPVLEDGDDTIPQLTKAEEAAGILRHQASAPAASSLPHSPEEEAASAPVLDE